MVPENNRSAEIQTQSSRGVVLWVVRIDLCERSGRDQRGLSNSPRAVAFLFCLSIRENLNGRSLSLERSLRGSQRGALTKKQSKSRTCSRLDRDQPLVLNRSPSLLPNRGTASSRCKFTLRLLQKWSEISLMLESLHWCA